MTYVQVVCERFWCILANFNQAILVLQALDGQSHSPDWVEALWLGSGAKANSARAGMEFACNNLY